VRRARLLHRTPPPLHPAVTPVPLTPPVPRNPSPSIAIRLLQRPLPEDALYPTPVRGVDLERVRDVQRGPLTDQSGGQASGVRCVVQSRVRAALPLDTSIGHVPLELVAPALRLWKDLCEGDLQVDPPADG
jgi:hypothetical protein